VQGERAERGDGARHRRTEDETAGGVYHAVPAGLEQPERGVAGDELGAQAVGVELGRAARLPDRARVETP
jgi:hypothetical protein